MLLVLSIVGLLARPTPTKLLPQAIIVYGERLPEHATLTTLLDIQMDNGMYPEITWGDTVLVLLRKAPEKGYRDFVFQKITTPITMMELDLMPGQLTKEIVLVCSKEYYILLKEEFQRIDVCPDAMVLGESFYAIFLDEGDLKILLQEHG